MNQTTKTSTGVAYQQNSFKSEGAASMPMHGRPLIDQRPRSFIDRGDYDEPWSDPMTGNRFLEL